MNKTSDLALHQALASSAVPAIFDTQTFKGVTYTDGGVKRNVPVISAIRKCLAKGYKDVEVTVLLVTAPQGPEVNYSNATTAAVLERTVSRRKIMDRLSISRYPVI